MELLDRGLGGIEAGAGGAGPGGGGLGILTPALEPPPVFMFVFTFPCAVAGLLAFVPFIAITVDESLRLLDFVRAQGKQNAAKNPMFSLPWLGFGLDLFGFDLLVDL